MEGLVLGATFVLGFVGFSAVGNGVDRCAVCVTFVALFAVVLVVCEGPFEVVAMLSAAGLMLITSLVMFVLLNLSWGLLATKVTHTAHQSTLLPIEHSPQSRYSLVQSQLSLSQDSSTAPEVSKRVTSLPVKETPKRE